MLPNSVTTCSMPMSRAEPERRSIVCAARRRICRSDLTLFSIRGRCSLTTTSRPSSRVARCTCASDAAASGFALKVAYSFSGGAPSSDSTTSRASSAENGLTSLWSFASSCSQSGGSESARLETICPNLTYVGPSSWRRSRTFTGSASGSTGCSGR